MKSNIRVHQRADVQGWERIVFAEVLIPDTPNVYGDYWTREAIKEAAYLFMREGYGIDVEHDNYDVSGSVYVAESFIARSGDPDFIEGSWVIGMKVEDDNLWQRILDNDLNGYSYEALVEFLAAVLHMEDDGIRTGTVDPDIEDGHVHDFMIMVDSDNRPVSGGTTETNGHAHTISKSTTTDEAAGHTHRYTIISGKDGK